MTNSILSCGTQCFLVFIASFVLWLAVASVLVWQTWNRVITVFFKVKAAKFSQALLLLVTICALLFPCAYMKKQCGKGHCKDSQDCPYSHSKGQEKTQE